MDHDDRADHGEVPAAMADAPVAAGHGTHHPLADPSRPVAAHADHAPSALAGAHQHAPGAPARGFAAVSWTMAAQATLHCLVGCAIGEVLGMVLGTAFGLPDAATVALAIVLAFAFGYGLTMLGVLRAGVDRRTALRVALAADTLSIALMELLDNTVMLVIPGAMDAGLTSVLFWASLASSLLVAFVLTTPVNRWMISRGRGHAVVHDYHAH